ncbi:chloride channel protein [Paludibacterium yongneupense]|uniref:chloride channel protein n=1 Tax=Paludibacterium yongneupense TaxID=400061 RepID=UPI000421B6EF|nr:chloride channel protein [Paludibacterium yongneupense]
MKVTALASRLQRRFDLFSSQTRATLVLWSGATLVGLVAVALAKASESAFHGFQLLAGRWPWWPFLALPVGGMLIRWLMTCIGQGAEGSGIPQALAALQLADTPRAARLLSARIALAKFVGIVMGVGSGFVLGREGPTVQIGAALMYACRRFVPDDAAFRRHLILAGGAAGIAAAFNTPLAGVVFAFEELANSIEQTTSGRTIGAVILAGIISLALLGNYTYFGRIHVPPFSFSIVLPMAMVAVGGGLIGGLFSWLCVHQTRWLPARVARWRQRHPYGFIAACGLLIALCGLALPIFGSGADETSRVIAGRGDLGAAYLPLKFVGLLATFLTGLPGGIFAPSLSLGAGLGSWVAPLFAPEVHIKIIALGMVAMLAGVTRAPITSAIIMIEMTDGHGMVISTLGAAMIAAGVARVFETRLYHDLAQKFLV